MSDRDLIGATERQSCRFDRIVGTQQEGPWTFYDVACKATVRVVRVACTDTTCTPVSRPEDDDPPPEEGPL